MTKIPSSFTATNQVVMPATARSPQTTCGRICIASTAQSSLSPREGVPTADDACYSLPKIRRPRDVNSQQLQRDTLQTSTLDEANTRLEGALLATQRFTVQIAQLLSIALPPVEQLVKSEANVSFLLGRQPNLQTVATAALQRALQHAFPELQQPINPDQIFVTQYAEKNNTVTTSLSQTLQQTLYQASINYPVTTTYNQSRTGFFYTANDVGSSNEIPGMKGSQHLLAFEKILEEQSSPNTRLRNYQQALQNFWSTPNHPLAGHTPTTWLARQYGQQRMAEAQLRVDDGTLTGTDLAWLTYLHNPAHATIQPGIFSLSLQDGMNNIPFAGILVLTQRPNEPPDTTSGPVLLTIPGQGLMKFDSATSYKEALQQLFGSTSQRDILLTHVAHGKRERAAELDHEIDASASPFRYQAIAGPEWRERMQSILDQKVEDIANVCHFSPTTPTVPDSFLQQAASLGTTFDLDGVLQKREQLRLQKFIAQASTNDKTAWFKELVQYRSALQKTETSGLPDISPYLDPAFLTRYARDHLRDQIKKDLNLEVDPDQVIVTTYELSLAYTSRGDLPSPPNARQSEKNPTRSTLTELALANTRMLDQNWGGELPVQTAQGTALPQLTRDYLTRIIRAANIGQHYKEFLQSRLLDSAEGKARENAYAQFLKAQLLLDTREATIRGDISADSAQWIRASMTASPVQINQRPVLAQSLHIDRSELNGILLFGTQSTFVLQSGNMRVEVNAHIGTSKIVLYTPNAPDGKNLREYANRIQMRSDFINHPTMHDYLQQRIERSRQHEIGNMLQNGIVNVQCRSEIISGSFLHASYRTEVAHIMADAEARTTSNEEADRQARWDKINRGLDIAGVLLPIKLSIPLSLMRASYALYSANQAHTRGNSEEALAEFLNGINLSLGAVSDGVGNLSIKDPSNLYRSTAYVSPARSSHGISAPAATLRKPIAPTGMSTMQIDGLSYFYWNSKNNLLRYRDLFVLDPMHPAQLKSTGYGALDANNVWKKISPLRGGGNTQKQSSLAQPSASDEAANPASSANLSPAAASNMQTTSILSITPPPPSPITKVALAGQANHFFSANVEGKNFDVFYNFEKNAFHEVNNIDARKNRQYYVLRDNSMHALNTRHHVTNSERETSLRALDINLELPLLTEKTADITPIPQVIRSIWIGDQLMPDNLIDNIQHNTSLAMTGETQYQTQLYLSNLDPVLFQRNSERLAQAAPRVEIIALEQSSFYQQFQLEHQGKYFAQYQAALSGNNGIAANFASAADILRYRLMRHEGGLYLDTDDRFLLAPGSIELSTSPTGLLLNRPVSNKILGMHMQYNNCIFGTHKNNPTLDAISEESYQRYLQNADVYTLPRPRKSTHSSQQLFDYMKRISHITGPGVLNTVIDEHLPYLHQLREAIKLRDDRNIEISADLVKKIDAWETQLLPLVKIDAMGNEHSWYEHR